MELGRLLVNTQDLSSKLYKQPNEEVKKEFVELVKRCYFDWMFHIKNPIFKKYTEKEDHYKNGPSFLHSFGKRWWINGWMEIRG